MRVAVVGAALLMALAACTGGESIATAPTAVPEQTAVADPTALPEATAVPDPTEVPDPTPIPDPTSTPVPPTAPPTATPQPVLNVAASPIAGFDEDRGFGWFTTTEGWEQDFTCASPATEQLVTFTMNGNIPIFSTANFVRSQVVRQLEFAPNGDAAVLLQCDDRWFIEAVTFDSQGQFLDTALRVELDGTGWHNNLIWVGEDEVRVDSTGPPYEGDDPNAWNRARTTINLGDRSSSTEVVTESWNPDGGPLEPLGTSPDGRLTWFTGSDPEGRLGCEAAGTATALFVSATASPDDATLATRDGSVFSYVSDVSFGPDNLMVWESQCEGYASYHAGRSTDEGIILDSHFIDIQTVHAAFPDAWVNIVNSSLRSDGQLVVLGSVGIDETGTAYAPVVDVIDLDDSPYWINSRAQPLDISSSYLALSIDGSETWHRGETTGVEPPGCGATTLYESNPDGYSRLLTMTQEIDTPVAVDASEILTMDFEFGPPSISRAVVVSTECPEEYEGRRIIGGIEYDTGWGEIWFEHVNLDDPDQTVAEVLGVTREYSDSIYASWIVVDVRLLDGTNDTIELRLPPFE